MTTESTSRTWSVYTAGEGCRISEDSTYGVPNELLWCSTHGHCVGEYRDPGDPHAWKPVGPWEPL